MRIIELIRNSLSHRKRLLHRLAETAADTEALAASLTRHSQMCSSPTLRASLAELATAESAQANSMRQLLLENSVLPTLPSSPLHEGSSNWERLRNDLTLQIRILRALHSQFAEWMAIDPPIGVRLSQSAAEEDRHIGQLRDLTLRCDPQALD